MPDNGLPPLPPGFTLDTPSAADQLGRPVIVKGTPPQPKTIVNGHVVDPNTATAVPIAGLPQTNPQDRKQLVSKGGQGAIVDLDTGNVTPVKLPEDSATVDPEEARAHVANILQSIQTAQKLLDNPMATGLPGSIFGHIPGTDAYHLRSLIGDPSDPNNPGQISGDLRQQGIAYLRSLNGGNGVGTVARSQQEQAALQSSMSNLRQGLDKDALKQSLDNVQQIYLRALARSEKLNPDDPKVQQQFGINPTWQPPGAAQAPQQPELYTTVPPADAGGDATRSFITNPKLQQFKAPLEQYINDPNVSNSMLLGFLQKNGIQVGRDIDADQWNKIMKERSEPDWWKKYSFPVEPKTALPQSTVQKVLTDIGTSAPGAALLGAADAATLGTAPDVVGSLPGFTRTALIESRDQSAANHPVATLLGNLAGTVVSPLAKTGVGAESSALAQAAKSVGTGATYGFFGSDDPNIESRLFNAGVGGVVGGVTHGVTDAGGRLAQGGYRAVAKPVESLIAGPEATADKYALNAAARGMPVQNMDAVKVANAAATNAGVAAPAAASIDRAGQDYLARTAGGSPQARAVADNAAQALRDAIPQQLAGDFNAAIQAAGPKNVSTYLNRPVRDIASDIQDMAGREYERGIAPIAKAQLTVTPELASDLDHERITSAVKDALANHQLDNGTRDELRALLPNLKALSSAPDMARNAYAKGIPLTVDGARNIATALDRTAGRLADGSEGQVELSRLSRDIRGTITEQFPEYAPVNARYASRMRAKQAMFDARQNFFASNPNQQDALAKAATKFTDEPNPPEFGAEPQTGPNGFQKPVQPLPSNRQLAATGAREAAQVAAGENGANTADRLANNANQRQNNATVLGTSGAKSVQNAAAARANVADTVNRVASGSNVDRSQSWYDTAKRALTLKMTGGAHSGQYMLAHAVAAVPGLSGDDAARVTRLYLDSDNADQVIKSLDDAYGARKRRFIMARIAAVTSAASGVRGFPQKPSQ
jgi:hypothetical protein